MQQPENIKSSSKSKWQDYGQLLVHHGLFKKGILVIKPKTAVDNFEITKSSFTLHETRRFEFEYLKVKFAVKKQYQLILSIFPDINSKFTLRNQNHRQEIYFPIILNSDRDQKIGCYIYAWSRGVAPRPASDLNQFVTCACLFGATLLALDVHGNVFPFIQHHHMPNKITELYQDKTRGVYEEVIYVEFARTVRIIETIVGKNKPVQLLCHIPYYDYFLYGLKLFIRSIISKDHLQFFVNLIFEKTRSYEQKIKHSVANTNIKMIIGSPFDNLFGNWQENFKLNNLLKNLNLSCEEDDYKKLDDHQMKELEHEMVRLCVTKLMTNNFCPLQKSVWQDHLGALEHSLLDIESLLRIGNTIMLSVTSKENNNRTCSIIPFTEKQIQVEHDRIHSKLTTAKKSNLNMIYLTTLDPVFAFTDTDGKEHNRYKGSLFYYANNQNALAELLIDNRLLESSYHNIASYSIK